LKKIFYLFLLLFFSLQSTAIAVDQILIDSAIKFIENPIELFNDMKTINEDLSPVIPKRHVSMRINTTLLPFLFPFSWPGVTLKTKLFSERPRGIPQIDLFGEYGEIVAMRSLSSEDMSKPPAFFDYTIGLNLTKSVTERSRIFLGGKTSSLNIVFSPKDPIQISSFTLSSIEIIESDTYLFTGIEHHSEANPNKYIIAYVGYGLKRNKLLARITMNYKHLELGMTILPESMLVVQPTIAYHWYF